MPILQQQFGQPRPFQGLADTRNDRISRLIIFMQLTQCVLLLLLWCNSCFAHQYSKQEEEVMKNIRCPICNGQSIYDSNNEISLEMRKIVVSLSAQHKSPAEIETIFKEKFGSEIIINQQGPRNYVLYLIPLLVGLSIFISFFRGSWNFCIFKN